ncbi:hypothetical protein NA57DRAFT_74458 [Rhizodiscina lignyota]|uniref:DUF6590 domain-containing protein n=1 Tax=Rhizodiscina lignyota TaxID=1504668 RepID=A0A9P4IH05_9PEZI|nr:hypothetical protein NA57DRAFT_74458 [Rhizodiscina lignyota]
MDPQWQWDEGRQMHCYYVPEEDAFHYQDGNVIPNDQPLHAQPRTGRNAPQRGSHPKGSNRSTMGSPYQSAPSPFLMDPQSTFQSDLSSVYEPASSSFPVDAQGMFQSDSYYAVNTSPMPRLRNRPSMHQGAIGPPFESPPEPYRLSTSSRGLSTSAQPSHLDPRFEVKNKPRKYFKKGRVFRTYWAEPGVDGHTDRATFNEPKFGEPVAAKIRWFLVVEAHHGHCLCVPITRHGGKATLKSGVNPRNYTALVPQGQKPAYLEGEEHFNRPLHIIVESDDEIDIASRVDFSKILTVEYNIKVATVGRIVPDDMKYVKTLLRRIALKDTNDSDDSGSGGEGADDDPGEDEENGKIQTSSTMSSFGLQRPGSSPMQRYLNEPPGITESLLAQEEQGNQRKRR